MLSAGVGAGIILDGRLYEGGTGTAGEIGHVVVDPGGQVCRCGNRGCLETVAGAVALTSSLRHTHGTRVNLDTVLRLTDDGDSGARRLIADAGEAVGRALAGVCSVLDPELIVIGGELAAAGDVLLDAIRETIERLTSPATGHSYSVQRGALGARAEALGAIALAMNHSAERASNRSRPPASVGDLTTAERLWPFRSGLIGLRSRRLGGRWYRDTLGASNRSGTEADVEKHRTIGSFERSGAEGREPALSPCHRQFITPAGLTTERPANVGRTRARPC
jgi:hypothetical protein